MLKFFALSILILVFATIGLATTRPDTFAVERSIHINAPPERIFAQINDLRAWEQWSPWASKDPGMEVTYSGATSGLGAISEWHGNREVGEGRMEIVDTSPGAHITLKLEFLKPFETTNTAEFSLSPNEGFTETRWQVSGPMPFVSKLFSLFLSMDAMIGPDFEQGLASLKAISEL